MSELGRSTGGSATRGRDTVRFSAAAGAWPAPGDTRETWGAAEAADGSARFATGASTGAEAASVRRGTFGAAEPPELVRMSGVERGRAGCGSGTDASEDAAASASSSSCQIWRRDRTASSPG